MADDLDDTAMAIDSGNGALMSTELIEGLEDEEFEGYADTLSQILFFPQEDQLEAAEIMFSLFEQPAPLPSAFLDDSATPRERSVVKKVLSSLKWMGQTRLDVIVAEDTSRKIRHLIENTWPHLLKWIKFLNANAHNIGARVSDPVIMTQTVIAHICAFLCDMCEPGCIPERTVTDPVIFAFAVSAYIKQDVDVLLTMDGEHAFSNAPALLLARVLINRTMPLLATTGASESLRLLIGRERTIVQHTLRHLRHVPKMSPNGIEPFHKIRAHVSLLCMLSDIESFVPLLSKNTVVSAAVASLKYTVDMSSVSSCALGQDPDLFSSTIRYSLKLIGKTFGRHRADLCVRVAVSDRAEQALAALSRIHNELRDDNARVVESLLTHISSYTICRTVVGAIIRSVHRAWKKDENLAQYHQIGNFWSILQRYATERFVCKYLFDEAYRRYGSKCVNCRRRIPRYEIKRCGVCRWDAYCSRRCQAMDWPEHKFTCKKAKLEREKWEAKVGRYDQFFRVLIARHDLYRLLPGIYDLVKRKDRRLSLDDIRIHLNYAIRRESLHPIISYTVLASGDANWTKERITSYTKTSFYDCVTSGAAKVFNVDIIVPDGKTSSAFNIFIPIDKRWMDVVYDTNNRLRKRRARHVTEEQYRRVEFRFRDLDRNGRLQPLEAARDDVDDVLYELERVTEVHPGWGIFKRVKRAAAKVESVVKKDGRYLYETWIS